MDELIQGKAVVAGEAEGEVILSHEPLSFWGGYDHATGEIIDRRHSLSGQIAKGKVLAIPFSRGSSTGTAVLLEAIKKNTAPAAILTTGVDAFFALAAIVAEEMYGRSIPIVALTETDFGKLQTGVRVQVGYDGVIKSA